MDSRMCRSTILISSLWDKRFDMDRFHSIMRRQNRRSFSIAGSGSTPASASGARKAAHGCRDRIRSRSPGAVLRARGAAPGARVGRALPRVSPRPAYPVHRDRRGGAEVAPCPGRASLSTHFVLAELIERRGRAALATPRGFGECATRPACAAFGVRGGSAERETRRGRAWPGMDAARPADVVRLRRPPSEAAPRAARPGFLREGGLMAAPIYHATSRPPRRGGRGPPGVTRPRALRRPRQRPERHSRHRPGQRPRPQR
jgi:hypothetical protein